MVQFTRRLLSRIRWSNGDVADFLGRYLSAPKPQVVFKAGNAKGALVRLDPKSQLLYYGTRFFMNGESFSHRQAAVLRELADRRALEAARLAPLAGLIREWQRAGYVYLTGKADG
jgi:50S ribosomal protein L16 3-hydroxylase